MLDRNNNYSANPHKLIYKEENFITLSFFPDQSNQSDVDAIYLDTGGVLGHRTITKIWKIAVDAQGNEFNDRITARSVDHYNYYQTEYNAGLGAEWFEKSKLNFKGEPTTGIMWVISTKQINENKNDNNPGVNPMRSALQKLIVAQRMVILEQKNTKHWQTWNDELLGYLSPRIDARSQKGRPQTSGNCTAMSPYLCMMDHIGPFLTQDFWQFLKKQESVKGMIAVVEKRLNSKLALLSVAKPPVNLIPLGNQEMIVEKKAPNSIEPFNFVQKQVQTMQSQKLTDQVKDEVLQMPAFGETKKEDLESKMPNIPFLSDHTYQTGIFKNSDGTQVTVATWNLMDKCHSKASHTQGLFTNNPWNQDEDYVTYLARKDKQFTKIIGIIKSGGKDVFLLQEIDFILHGERGMTWDKSQTSTLIKKHQQLYNDFIDELKNIGWALIKTEPNQKTSTEKQQQMAILYNTKTLTPSNNKGNGIFKNNKNIFRGFLQPFTYKHNNGKTTDVDICNLHLDYDEDYSQSIPAFQKAQIKNNKFTIAGGDTNHAPNKNITGLINDWNNITNISFNPATAEITHIHTPGVAKCYDGFFVNPSLNCSATAQEGESEVFKHVNGNEFKIEKINTGRFHQTKLNQPCVKGAFTIEIVDDNNENELKIDPPKSTDAVFSAPLPATVSKLNSVSFFSSPELSVEPSEFTPKFTYGENSSSKALRIICENYLVHLKNFNENFRDAELTQQKKDIMRQLLVILDQAKKPEERVREFYTCFNSAYKPSAGVPALEPSKNPPTCHQMLEKRRDSVSRFLVKCILTILSLGFVFLPVVGMWKKEGKKVSDDILASQSQKNPGGFIQPTQKKLVI